MFEFDRNLAVIIGIDAYEPGIPHLTTAANDAKKIAQLLKDKHEYKPEQVWTFLDADATQDRLDDFFQKTLPNTVQANDRLVFYFAGHGIALPGEEGPQGYLIPQNAKLGDSTTYIRMTDVEKALTQLSCRHCLVILDCCFAGAFRWASTRDIAVVPESIHKERYDRFIADPAWQVITSAAYDQKALDSLKFVEDSDRGIIDGSDGQHSPFAAALIEALSGKADAFPPAQDDKPAGDGIITATELYMYLRDRVEKLTEKHNKRQTPGLWLLKKHDKGEYIFLTQDFKRDKLEDAPSLDDQEENNPYRGLKPYEKEHADLFFGRTSLIEKLCDFVSVKVNEKNRQLTIVLGASGSGKSSLIKAGLIPHLANPENLSQKRDLNHKIQAHQHKHQTWHILPVIRPGESPLNSLNTAFKDIVPEGSKVGFSEAIGSWGKQHPDSRILLTIDQFEELITQCKDEAERKEFLTLLANALQACPNFSLMLTLRSDFEPQFRDTVLEEDWKESRFIVPAMTREELREVIEEPASAKVVFFKPHELIEQLIDEVAQMPGALPLLSFALSELYIQLAQRYLDAQNNGEIAERAITQDDYDKLGGVTRSLTQRADREYDALVNEDPAYEQTIRHVMLRMVSVGGELARRRVYFSELEYPEPENRRVKEVIKRFDAARLLTSDKDDEGRPYVEPAHDVLVRGWQKLSDWKQQGLANLLLQRDLTPTANEWTNSSKKGDSRGLLWDDDPRLLLAMQLLCGTVYKDTWFNFWKWIWGDKFWKGKSNNFWLNSSEQTFVVDSFEQKNTKRRNTLGIASGVFTTLLGLALWAINNANIAEVRRINADIKASSLSAKNLLENNQQLEATITAIRAGRLLYDKEKVGIDPEVQMQAITALQTVVYIQRFPNKIELPSFREINRLEGINSGTQVNSISFSPDGNMIASGNGDNSIKLWKRDGTLVKALEGHTKSVQSISFSPDNRTLVSASDDNTLKLWDLENGTLIRSFEGYGGSIFTVSFSPNGQLIASASDDGTIKIWNLEGSLIRNIEKAHFPSSYNSPVRSIQFSPDGNLLVSGGYDSLVKIWTTDGKLLKSFNHGDIVWDTKFSPDGQTIASAGQDKTVKLWNHDGVLLRTLKGHLAAVRRIAFSPDGETLVSSSEDNTVKIWSTSGSLQSKILKGHSGRVWDVAFSPGTSETQVLASASADGTVKLWQQDKNFLKRLDVGSVPDFVKYSHDGKILATGNESGTVLWNIENNQVSSLDTGPTQNVSFSLDGKILAIAGSHTKNVRLWNLTTNESKILEGHKNTVSSVLFNPYDGKILASGSWDKTVKLWNFDNLDGKISKSCDDKGYVSSLSFNPDGKLLAFGSWDNTVKLWRWNLDCKAIETVITHGGRVWDVIFSPDGKMIASASDDNTIKLRTLGEAETKTFRGHNGWVINLSFHPNGRIFASGSADETVKLWSVDNVTEIDTLKSYQPQNKLGMWTRVSFSPDGKTLASSSPGDRTIVLWNFDLKDLLAQACGVARDYLQTNPNVNKEDRKLCQG